MLAEEAPRLHRIPDTAHTVAFGLARTVPENTPMVTFENAQYSVPSHLLGARVFVRTHGTGPDEQVIIVHHGTAGPVEVARHGRARPGSPAINDEHFPGTRAKVPGAYEVRARSADETAFLAIGEGARTWLIEAAAVGTARMNVKTAEAVTLAKIAGADQVDRALGDAALHGRFAHQDLASILNSNIRRTTTHAAPAQPSTGSSHQIFMSVRRSEEAVNPPPSIMRTGGACSFHLYSAMACSAIRKDSSAAGAPQ